MRSRFNIPLSGARLLSWRGADNEIFAYLAFSLEYKQDKEYTVYKIQKNERKIIHTSDSIQDMRIWGERESGKQNRESLNG